MAKPTELIRVGFDEAGLGPTLGPLVVAGLATSSSSNDAFDGAPVDDLHRALASVLGPPGVRDGRIELGDSKKIHMGTRKLERIERSALAAVGWVHGQVPSSVAQLLELVLVRGFEQPEDRRAPWWSMLDEALPIANSREAITADIERLRSAAKRVGIRPRWYGADIIDPARINRELAAEDDIEGGSKNTWATHAVLRMAAHASAQLDGPQLSIWCDKAGGRQAYVPPIVRAFGVEGDGGRVCTREQIRERSCYAIELGSRAIELGFVMGGDRLDPRISWGSILAKYLRELIVRAFNRYFAARVAGLRSTAGYPEDARRFIDEVEAALGVDGGLERAAWIRCK